MSTSLETMSKNLPKLWQLGDHRLLQGDALKMEDVDRLFGSDKASLILTDPPYGVDYVESKQEFLQTIHHDSKKAHAPIKGDSGTDDYYRFSRIWLDLAQPHLTAKNAFYIFNGDTKLREFMNALHDAKYTKSALLIWIKNRFVVGRKDYHPQHELIVYGWHGTHSYFGNKDKSALFYANPRKNALHPTMKPPPLLRRLLYHSTKPGDVIYDPFGGSGSTLVACEQLGRRCLMIEYEEKYCQAVIGRWEKLTGKKAKLLAL